MIHWDCADETVRNMFNKLELFFRVVEAKLQSSSVATT